MTMIQYVRLISIIMIMLLFNTGNSASADFNIKVSVDSVQTSQEVMVSLNITMANPSNNMPYTYQLYYNNFKDSLIQEVTTRLPSIQFDSLQDDQTYYILIHDNNWKNVDGKQIKF